MSSKKTILLPAFLCVAIALTFYLVKSPVFFWDFHTYYYAAEDFNNDINPYFNQYGRLRFVYSPLVLYLFSFIQPVLYAVSSMAYISALMFFFKSLGEAKKISIAMVISFLLFDMFEDVGFFRGLLSGNFSTYLHLGLFYFITQIKKIKLDINNILFALILIFGAILKPYYLAYTLVFPVLFKFNLVSIIHSFALIFLCIAIYVLDFSINQELFYNFLNSLQLQTIATNDLGYNLAPIINLAIENYYIALIINYLALAAMFFVWSKFLFKKNNFFLIEHHLQKIIFLVLCVVLINPRLKVYDYGFSNLLITYLLLNLNLHKIMRLKLKSFIYSSSVIIFLTGMFLSYDASLDAGYISTIAREILIWLAPFTLTLLLIIFGFYEKRSNPSS